MQPYVFVSHASVDKRERVRPVVRALAWHGLKLWIDRPGHGPSHFEFDNAYIERHGILGLRTGEDYRAQLQGALRGANAILVCLSKALLSPDRLILMQEISFAAIQNNLVACVVDDVPFSALPPNVGLPDLVHLQAEQIVAGELDAAVEHMEAYPDADAAALPPAQKEQWEIASRLARQLRNLLPPYLDNVTAAALRARLAQFPIGPPVRFFEISAELISYIANANANPIWNSNLLILAMGLRADCNHEGFAAPQILLTLGEVLAPAQVTPEEYWTDVLARAGGKSRRTLAAILLLPGVAPRMQLPPALRNVFDEFMTALEKPDAAVQPT